MRTSISCSSFIVQVAVQQHHSEFSSLFQAQLVAVFLQCHDETMTAEIDRFTWCIDYPQTFLQNIVILTGKLKLDVGKLFYSVVIAQVYEEN